MLRNAFEHQVWITNHVFKTRLASHSHWECSMFLRLSWTPSSLWSLLRCCKIKFWNSYLCLSHLGDEISNWFCWRIFCKIGLFICWASGRLSRLVLAKNSVRRLCPPKKRLRQEFEIARWFLNKIWIIVQFYNEFDNNVVSKIAFYFSPVNNITLSTQNITILFFSSLNCAM